MQKKVEIFTDGACRGNPGPGGWGALLRYNHHTKELKGSEAQTTNNRMELTAVIEGLKSLKEACYVELTTDSKYVKRGMEEWLPKWKENGWKTAAKKPVKNVDLWQMLDKLIEKLKEEEDHEINVYWVKGHSGHPENEQADALANQAIDTLLKCESSAVEGYEERSKGG